MSDDWWTILVVGLCLLKPGNSCVEAEHISRSNPLPASACTEMVREIKRDHRRLKLLISRAYPHRKESEDVDVWVACEKIPTEIVMNSRRE